MTVCATASSLTWIIATVAIASITQLIVTLWIHRTPRPNKCRPGACISTGQLDANCRCRTSHGR